MVSLFKSKPLLLVIGLVIVIVLYMLKQQVNVSLLTSRPFPSLDDNQFKRQRIEIIETVKSGAELGLDQCPQGFYLPVTDGGRAYVQLRQKNSHGETELMTDSRYLNKQVKMVAIYPAQEVFCEALTCLCDDFMLVESIQIIE